MLRFQYLYVGLPGLAAESYAAGDNWLGVALSALMKIPRDRAVELGRQALTRLRTADLLAQKRNLLEECVEAYLPVGADEMAAIHDTILKTPEEKIVYRNLTSYDLGLAAGRQEGRQEGREEGVRIGLIETMEAQLDTRFGSLSESTLTALRGKSTVELRSLLKSVLAAQSLAELGL